MINMQQTFHIPIEDKMKFMRRVFIIALLCCLSIQATLGQVTKISLDQAIDFAQRQSYFSKHGKRNYQIDKIHFDLYKIGRLPQLSLSLTPLEYTKDSKYVAGGDGVNKNYKSTTNNYGALSLRQPVTFVGGRIVSGVKNG
ncbi:hypothetical protein OAA06_01655 [bacterium]|nr:hypothetical protein [bacterium]